MNSERDFWRLLKEFERLTRDESFSLNCEDFPEVATLQKTKDALFSKLAELAIECGLDRSNADLARRVDRLIETGRRNEKLVGTILARARMEKRGIDATRLRLRELGNLYVTEKSERCRFSALV